jgi:hypothetical protein
MPAPLEDGSDDGTDGDDSLPARQRRCADLDLANGAVVIYDVENHNAWLQSDGAVAIDALE